MAAKASVGENLKRGEARVDGLGENFGAARIAGEEGTESMVQRCAVLAGREGSGTGIGAWL